MSLRTEWKFTFTANDLYLAAERMRTYHELRREHWATRHTAAVEKAKHTTVQVREVDVTGGKQAQVVIDPTIQNEINTAQRKRDDHDAKAREYATWSDSFHLMPDEQRYELEPDDVDFFDMTRSRVDADDDEYFAFGEAGNLLEALREEVPGCDVVYDSVFGFQVVSPEEAETRHARVIQ